MKYKIGDKEYNFSKNDIENIVQKQDDASKLISEHLAEPINKIVSERICSDQVLACALIELAYFTLRGNRTSEDAEKTFDVFSHFAKMRINSGIEKHSPDGSLH